MTTATCGLTSRTPFAYYDPDAASLRTSQGTFPWDSTSSSLTLPRWGSMRGGELYELPTPALPTAELESSSLLGTPRCAHGMAHNPRDGVENPRGRLEDQVSLLPTPRATDGIKGGPNQRGSSGDLMLPSAVQLLPTPSVSDGTGGHMNRSGDRSGELLLPGVARAISRGEPTNPPSDGGSEWSDVPLPLPPNPEHGADNG